MLICRPVSVTEFPLGSFALKTIAIWEAFVIPVSLKVRVSVCEAPVFTLPTFVVPPLASTPTSDVTWTRSLSDLAVSGRLRLSALGAGSCSGRSDYGDVHQPNPVHSKGRRDDQGRPEAVGSSETSISRCRRRVDGFLSSHRAVRRGGDLGGTKRRDGGQVGLEDSSDGQCADRDTTGV